MDNFIKKVLEIDKEACIYESDLEKRKTELLDDRQQKLKQIDDYYDSVIEKEKNDLNNKIKEVEEKDKSNLEDYENRAKEIKTLFEQKKEYLLDKISKSLLEGGD